jgi:hypothetical protein
MNTIQAISENSAVSGRLLFGSPVSSSYLWENLVSGKRSAEGWLHQLYKGSVLYAFWSVFSSRMS